MNTKETTEGTKFVSGDFSKLDTVDKWRKAFPSRYAGLPEKIAKAFAERDMKNAQ